MKQFNLEEYLKNPSRKVVTRDGRNVRIVRKNGKDPIYPVIASTIKYHVEDTMSYTKDGKLLLGQESSLDLFFATEKHEGWVNIYRDIYMGTHAGPIFNSKEEAEWDVRRDSLKEKSLSSYLATVKIEWEE